MQIRNRDRNECEVPVEDSAVLVQSSRRTMKEFGPQDVNQLLHRSFAMYLRVRNPSANLQRLMKYATAVVNSLHGQHSSSQDVVGQCVSLLSRLQEVLHEGTSTRALGIFRRRSQKSLEKEVDELWERVQAIKGDFHTLTNASQTKLPVAGSGIRRLISMLARGQGETRRAAVRKLAVLATDATTSRAIAGAGGIPILVSLLDENDNPSSQIHASRALANIALTDSGNLDSILYHGGLEKLCVLLFSSNSALQEQAARCIGNIADSFQGTMTKAWSQAIIGLVGMLNTSSWSKVQTVRAVTGLAKHPGLRGELVDCGAVKPLLQLSMSGCKVTSHLAVRAIAFLSIDEEHSIMLAKEGTVQVFLSILSRNFLHQRFKENLMCSLANIAALVRSSGTRSKTWEKGIWLLVRGCAEQSAVCRRNSVLALAHLSRRKSLQWAMTKSEAIPWLVELMVSDDLASVQRATIAVANIASSRKCASSAHLQIIESSGASVLSDMVKKEDSLCREQACRILARLSLRRQFHGKILSCGVVQALLDMLKDQRSTSPTCAGFAVCTLAALSRTTNGLDEIRRCGGTRALTRLGGGNIVCKRNRAIILTRLKDRSAS
ncbi:hypothetical protein BSKO_11889 [Bryopsis sp. KO-2023]|nr:hypothetical protein BSKO_11889 [Bryopsis sp. KO-2023]